MSAVGWTSWMRLLRRLGTRLGGPRTHIPRGRKTAPVLETLETLSLLSAVGPKLGAAAVRLHDSGHHGLAAPVARPHGPGTYGTANDSTLQTTTPQTLSLGNTLTNFKNLPLSPSLNLFNPSLGTLVSVTLNQSSTLQSAITSRNLSPSPTVITASLSGSDQIDGLNQPIVHPTETVTSQPVTAGPFGSGNDTVTFPPLQISHPTSTIFSDPASLAFFTASPGRTTVTATMTATGTGGAGALTSLFTTALTSASASVSVSYTYLLPPCPTAGPVGRIGLHHQRTVLVLPFNGPVNPVLAGTPSDYFVTTATGRKIPIVSADYNPGTNSVTLRPAVPLNVHDRYHLTATLPCPDGDTSDVVHIPFGTKYSLIGFHDHQGQFVPVRGGRIVRSEPQPRPQDQPGASR